VETINGKADNADVWQGQIGYAFSNSMIKGMYGQKSMDALSNPGDIKSWAFGLNRNFSKRTKVYALYTRINEERKNSTGDGFL